MTAKVPTGSIPEPVVGICRRLREAGHRAWIVGGSVRDLLIGREVGDWDIATSARPEQVQKVFRKVIPTGIQHGTVTVVQRGVHYEVTTLRGETTYSDGRHPDHVYFVDDIEADLARRDFTANAIAHDPVDGVTIDPWNGLADIERGLLRAVGEPRERFAEDGLRVLRAARFVATLEMELDPDTERAIRPSLDTFRKVSHERVRDEWLKALAARQPSRAFRVMQRTGILEVTLPELVEQVGCEQNRYHAYDVWDHTLACTDAMEGDAVDRLAALLHDLGKPRSRDVSDKTGDYTFYHHEVIGADMASRWMRGYRFSNAERDRVVRLIRQHLIAYTDEWTDAAVRRFIKRVGGDLIDPLVRLARADALAKGRPVDEELARLDELVDRVETELAAGAALTTRDLAIGGGDVMKHLDIAPGPLVGRVLERLLERVLEDPALNDRDRLLALADHEARSLAEGEHP